MTTLKIEPEILESLWAAAILANQIGVNIYVIRSRDGIVRTDTPNMSWIDPKRCVAMVKPNPRHEDKKRNEQRQHDGAAVFNDATIVAIAPVDTPKISTTEMPTIPGLIAPIHNWSLPNCLKPE